MKIGELARRSGLNASAIRYYEKMGVLAPPQRASGQRRYAEESLHRLLLIRFAGSMGFTLGEIKIFLGGLRSNTPVGSRWRKLARGKIKEVARNIECSRHLKALLEDLLSCQCASLRVCVERLRLCANMKRIGDDA